VLHFVFCPKTTGGAFTKKMTPEEIDGCAERNQRLRELCGELNNLG